MSPKIDCSAVVKGVQKTFYLAVAAMAPKTVFSTLVTAVTKTVYLTVETMQNLIALIDHETAAKNPQVLLLPLVIKRSIQFFVQIHCCILFEKCIYFVV